MKSYNWVACVAGRIHELVIFGVGAAVLLDSWGFVTHVHGLDAKIKVHRVKSHRL